MDRDIPFYCRVNGKDLMAKIIALVEHPLYFVYRIRFSDGYEDDFSLMEGGYVEPEKKGTSGAYAAAIKEDLKVVWRVQADKEIYTMRWMIDGVHTNVWIKEGESEGEQVYAVYYNGDYRFEMKRQGAGWFWRSKRVIDPETVNEKLAAEIGRMIDKEMGK